ncbi:MAG: glycosyltransferase, partial [Fibrobacterota bacterium]
MELSLCIIAKNEEENLPVLLESIKETCSQIIVVDTGSGDATKEIARSFGAEVYEKPWNDNFSEARNFSLEKAAKPWVMWADADDYFPPES